MPYLEPMRLNDGREAYGMKWRRGTRRQAAIPATQPCQYCNRALFGRGERVLSRFVVYEDAGRVHRLCFRMILKSEVEDMGYTFPVTYFD